MTDLTENLIRRTAYDKDVAAWATEQAALLRAGELLSIDAKHLAEEIEALSARDKRELRRRLALLLQYLLKWQFQPTHRGDSWTTIMLEQRWNIQAIFEDSPSLAEFLDTKLGSAYSLAVRQAATETKLPLQDFPKKCPYSLSDVLGDDWLPG